MFNRLSKNILTSIIFMCLLFGNIIPANAQTSTDSDVIFFTQLGESDSYIMRGPFDEDRIVFGVPADWELIDGASLQLFLRVTFRNNVAAGVDPTLPQSQNGGTLSVILNNVLADTIPLDVLGEQSIDINIPFDALRSRRDDKMMDLQLILDSMTNCDVLQDTTIVVRGSSNIKLPHRTILPDTSLVNFPYTISHNTFIPDSAIIVVPDQPTAAEMQSALTVAAGLGNLTSTNFLMSITSLGSLTPELRLANHLILVGNAGSLPLLTEFGSEVSYVSGSFNLAGMAATDGIIQMVNSPWSSAHAVLIVSGNSDEGTVKAAQALSTGVIRPSSAPNISIVEKVNDTPSTAAILTDTTLADLGYSNRTIQSRGLQTSTFAFYIPPGKTVASDAYFELAYGHSNLLNYDRSGAVIRLNGQPVGNLIMNDDTASNAINLIQIDLPAELITPGTNTIEVRLNLIPKDVCTSLDLRGEWVSIWAQSKLHLPLVEVLPVVAESLVNLSNYPAPFVNQQNMSQTAFILEKDNISTWQSALRIARYLGSRTAGAMSTLKVFFADEAPAEDLADYDLILIGRPTKMKIAQDINPYLPAPFEQGDIATENGVQVNYQIPADSPIGYIQMLKSPWNSEKIILAVLGNTAQGVDWAAIPLGDSPLRARLGGNFASINDQQIITADTRFDDGTSQSRAPIPVPTLLVPAVATIPITPVNNWIPLALGVSIALLVLTLLGIIASSWLRNRSRTRIRGNTENR